MRGDETAMTTRQRQPILVSLINGAATRDRLGISLLSVVLCFACAAQTNPNAKSGMAAHAKASTAGKGASANGKHPVPLEANTPTSACLECHGDLKQRKFVHVAMSMGCDTCHRIDSKNGATHVTLVEPSDKLCVTCHTLSSDKVLHGPYRQGLCVTCHSPHSSEFPAHTWVSAQDTCLGCHAR